MATDKVAIEIDKEKQSLLYHYLDIDWCDDVTHLRCVHCHRVAIHQYVSNCHHIYCHNCMVICRGGGRRKCPQCQEYVTQLSDHDWELEDQIFQINVYCPNKRNGCEYVGKLSTISDHLRGCVITPKAAIPDNLNEISLKNVSDQLTKLNAAMEAMQTEVGNLRSEMKDLKGKFATNRKQLKKTKDKFTRDQRVQTQRLDNMEQNRIGVEERRAKDIEETKIELKSTMKKNKKYQIKLIKKLNKTNLTIFKTKMEEMAKNLGDQLEHRVETDQSGDTEQLDKTPNVNASLNDDQPVKINDDIEEKEMDLIVNSERKGESTSDRRWDLGGQTEQVANVEQPQKEAHQNRAKVKENVPQLKSELSSKVAKSETLPIEDKISEMKEIQKSHSERMAHLEQRMIAREAEDGKILNRIEMLKEEMQKLSTDLWSTIEQMEKMLLGTIKEVANLESRLKDLNDGRKGNVAEENVQMINKSDEDHNKDQKINQRQVAMFFLFCCFIQLRRDAHQRNQFLETVS